MRSGGRALKGEGVAAASLRNAVNLPVHVARLSLTKHTSERSYSTKNLHVSHRWAFVTSEAKTHCFPKIPNTMHFEIHTLQIILERGHFQGMFRPHHI